MSSWPCPLDQMEKKEVVRKKARVLRNKTSKLLHKQSNMKYRFYSNPVKISNNEFVIAINSNKQLIKYNVNDKQWTELFNYDDNLDEKMEDWTKKTNFKNVKYVGYICDNGVIAVADMVRECKNAKKIFLHFHEEQAIAGSKYSYIDVPNNKLCVPPSISSDSSSKLLYDKLNNIYYVIDNDNIHTMIDMNNKTVKTSIVDKTYSVQSCVVIDGNIHSIARNSEFHYHVIFDYSAKTNEIKHQFNELSSPQIIYNASQNVLFLIDRSSKIWKYSLENKVWSKSVVLKPYEYEITIPSNIMLTNNDRFVITFDSEQSSVLDLETMTFTKLDNIMWPNGCTPTYSINTRNISNIDRMIIYGFTRNIWRENNLSFLFPPNEILTLIAIFYKQECIHLLRNNKHSIINVLDLIPTYSSIL